MTQDEELRLIRRVQAGDAEAFEDLVRAHEKTVYNLALRMTGHPQDAEDMAQAASRAAEAVECYLEKGPDKAMNLYNTR